MFHKVRITNFVLNFITIRFSVPYDEPNRYSLSLRFLGKLLFLSKQMLNLSFEVKRTFRL